MVGEYDGGTGEYDLSDVLDRSSSDSSSSIGTYSAVGPPSSPSSSLLSHKFITTGSSISCRWRNNDGGSGSRYASSEKVAESLSDSSFPSELAPLDSSSEESSLSLSPKTLCAVRGGGGRHSGAAAGAAARLWLKPRSSKEMDAISLVASQQRAGAVLTVLAHVRLNAVRIRLLLRYRCDACVFSQALNLAAALSGRMCECASAVRARGQSRSRNRVVVLVLRR